MKECPCYLNKQDCTRRRKDCHATCKDFKDWRAEFEKDKNAKAQKGDEYLDYIIPKINKGRKRKNEKNRT